MKAEKKEKAIGGEKKVKSLGGGSSSGKAEKSPGKSGASKRVMKQSADVEEGVRKRLMDHAARWSSRRRRNFLQMVYKFNRFHTLYKNELGYTDIEMAFNSIPRFNNPGYDWRNDLTEQVMIDALKKKKTMKVGKSGYDKSGSAFYRFAKNFMHQEKNHGELMLSETFPNYILDAVVALIPIPLPMEPYYSYM